MPRPATNTRGSNGVPFDTSVSSKPCPDCSKLVPCKATNGRVYARRCDECAFTALRRKQRASMATQRRKMGIPLVKGTVIQCSVCSNDIVLERCASRKFCEPCALERSRERAREVSRARRSVPGGYRYQYEWSKKKRRESAPHAINYRFRLAIRRSLARGKRGSSWESLVGYSLDDLMIHLERQFKGRMSWGNRGKWHIDHIQPLSSFKFTTPDDPDFKAAWALSNLRPLWAKENLSKNAKRTHLL